MLCTRRPGPSPTIENAMDTALEMDLRDLPARSVTHLVFGLCETTSVVCRVLEETAHSQGTVWQGCAVLEKGTATVETTV